MLKHTDNTDILEIGRWLATEEDDGPFGIGAIDLSLKSRETMETNKPPKHYCSGPQQCSGDGKAWSQRFVQIWPEKFTVQ